MTNEQKYKTARERKSVFEEWCQRRECNSCEIGSQSKYAFDCPFHWLALEADEKPEPCPFCGANCNVVSIESKSMYFLKCHCGCGYQSGYKSLPKAAIMDHNRVARAVRAAREGEVK